MGIQKRFFLLRFSLFKNKALHAKWSRCIVTFDLSKVAWQHAKGQEKGVSQFQLSKPQLSKRFCIKYVRSYLEIKCEVSTVIDSLLNGHREL